MHRRTLLRPDGRALHLYARAPLPDDLSADGLLLAPPRAGSHLRWHPLRGEWVVYATHRQDRTFLPSAAANPLAPMHDPALPTEVPAGPWEIAAFDNRFPALSTGGGEAPELPVPTRPGDGACEVVVFGQDPTASLGSLPLAQIELLFEVWGDRTRELGARPEIQYVFPFENRGVEVGVTLNHPHGQIYAYPFVPPIPARALALQAEHWAANGRGLVEDLIQEERDAGTRLLYESPEAVAWMPVFARYAYEVWVAPTRAVPTLADLLPAERTAFARALKTVLLKYDGLWGTPFPYLLVFHQAPTDGRPHPEAHLHIELYPPLRMPGRLKYLAGTEIGAGVFTADTLPEEKAAELRAVPVTLA
ncbi:MAG: galactose-1-phosphate uridylyltransferase [Pseudomonadota bacterium]|nr:galactose-1-phosphate uridylyltransferase [Pseudomonadota bacterium]